MKFENTLAFARQLDKQDSLKSFRKLFHIPKVNGKEAIYLCGNSLGLQPKSVQKHIQQELNDWANLGVEGHLHAKNPWLSYHKLFTKSLAKLVGAKPHEVVAMNQLTVNLNLLLVSFYQPKGKRNKILIQSNEFPSDYYAFEQQVKFHGLDPKECIIEVMPRKGEYTLRTEDILAKIKQHKNELALVMFSAVNYYTGQFFEVKKIGEACCKHKITFGLDLAHAIGNVPLKLHEWNVDFATWCSYKYLNSGPGGVSGVFIHEHHADSFSLARFAGWWGNEEKIRFKMEKHFVPQRGAEGWQLSNAPILSMAAHKASLEIFDQVSMRDLRKKSELLTGYLDYLLANNTKYEFTHYQVITPAKKNHRGCQLSIKILNNGKNIFDKIIKHDVMADWREPDVIRITPVPLYTSFEDVFRFAQILANSC